MNMPNGVRDQKDLKSHKSPSSQNDDPAKDSRALYAHFILHAQKGAIEVTHGLDRYQKRWIYIYQGQLFDDVDDKLENAKRCVLFTDHPLPTLSQRIQQWIQKAPQCRYDWEVVSLGFFSGRSAGYPSGRSDIAATLTQYRLAEMPRARKMVTCQFPGCACQIDSCAYAKHLAEHARSRVMRAHRTFLDETVFL